MLPVTVQVKGLHYAGNIKDIKEGKITNVKVEGKRILLIRKGDKIHAIDSLCGEGCGPLDKGLLEGYFIRCPWYHEYYDIRTGKPLEVVHCKSGIRTYKTKINEKNGDVLVKMENN